MIVMLVMVAIAVAIFIHSGSKTAPYEYLERRDHFKSDYVRSNMIGACLCVTALIPLFGGAVINEENDLLMALMLCISFVIAGIGVVFFIKVGIIWESYKKLLQEGDYTRTKKEHRSFQSVITTVYWLVATAIYLSFSLPTESWKEGWIVWVIAAVLFPAVIAIANAIENNRRK